MEIRWHDMQASKLYVNSRHNVVWLTWPAIENLPGILHGFSTRLGGVSQGMFSSMNLSFSRGDAREAVEENYRRLGKAMGFSPEELVVSSQTHTTNVRVVTKADCGNLFDESRAFHDVDGMITDEPGVVLATFYADCVPSYFVDPVHHAIGLSHSGWRGTVGKMAAETAKRMRETFGTRPEELITAIGPSICQNCYEVGEDVAGQFRLAFDSKYHPALLKEAPGGKYHLNLWEANRICLLEAGVPAKNIHLPNLCTCCNPDFLFSHRATGGKRGNMGAFLGLK